MYNSLKPINISTAERLPSTIYGIAGKRGPKALLPPGGQCGSSSPSSPSGLGSPSLCLQSFMLLTLRVSLGLWRRCKVQVQRGRWLRHLGLKWPVPEVALPGCSDTKSPVHGWKLGVLRACLQVVSSPLGWMLFLGMCWAGRSSSPAMGCGEHVSSVSVWAADCNLPVDAAGGFEPSQPSVLPLAWPERQGGLLCS